MGRRFFGSVVGAAVLMAVVLFFPGPRSASALQASCAAADVSVATQDALFEAIDCFNAQTPTGNHTITFQADISVTQGLPAITAGDATAELVIFGNGHTLSGPTPTVSNLIDHNRLGSLRIDALTLSNAGALVRVRSGSVEIDRSTLQTATNAIVVNGGRLVVASSTIEGNGDGLRVSAGSALVSNSTFAANSIGIHLTTASANVIVANTTFDDSGVSLSPRNGSMEVVSTIVEGPSQCLSSLLVVDGGNNFSGSAQTCGFQSLTPGSLGDIAEANGCTGPCTNTIALSQSSNAVDNGRCINVPVGFDAAGSVLLGDLTVDQRGVARTSACEPGSFELEPPTCSATGASVVGTELELFTAIQCFNQQDPLGDHTITLNANVAVDLLPAITQANAGRSLVIDGAGHVLSAIPMSNNTPDGLISFDSPGSLRINNLMLEHEEGAAVEVLRGSVVVAGSELRNSEEGMTVSAGNVRVEQSLLTGNGKAVHLTGGALELDESVVSLNSRGITVSRSELRVTHSTISDQDQELLQILSGTVLVSSSSLHDGFITITGGSTLISNSTISQLSFSSEIRNGSVVVSNSTVFASAPLTTRGGSIELVSSILGSGCEVISGSITGWSYAPVDTCDGSVVLSPGSLASSLAANGCSGPSCTQTVELLEGSSAVGRGACDGVPIDINADGSLIFGALTFDQRGEGFPRVRGAQCDVGAFEAQTSAPAWSCGSNSVVINESDLNSAIDCYNFQAPPGDHTITLGADIDLNQRLNTVTLDSLATRLTIDGADHFVKLDDDLSEAVVTIRGSTHLYLDQILLDADGNTALRVGEEAGEVWVIDSGIVGRVDVEGGAFVLLRSLLRDSHSIGINATGGSVSVYRSFITATQTAIDSSATLLGVGYSIISGGNTAILVDGNQRSDVEILGSTIFDSSVGVNVGGRNTSTLITNSTLWNNFEGVRINSGDVAISNSTIALGRRAIVKVTAQGNATVTSSILASETDCSDRFDGTNNFSQASNCGAGFTQLTADDFAEFGTFEDHGCTFEVETPFGCTASLSLLGGHSAIGAGKCDDVQVRYDATGPLDIDQRGLPRSPNNCDAGAFESSAAQCGGRGVTIMWGPGATGTDGDDVILGTPGDDVIDGGLGDDTICGGDGDDQITGGPGHDQILGEAGDDVILGGAGRDTILGGAGADLVRGQTGSDTILGGAGDDKLYGSLGLDVLSGGDGKDTVFGGPGVDSIFGGRGADKLYGVGGDDLMDGGLGNDSMWGLSGDDTMFGGAGNDSMFGVAGNDTLSGNAGQDFLGGGLGDDVLKGGNGNDTLNGSAGRDNLKGNNGTDTCKGGPDDDIVDTVSCETVS